MLPGCSSLRMENGGFLDHFWGHQGHPGPASINISRITLRFLSWSTVSVRLCTSSDDRRFWVPGKFNQHRGWVGASSCFVTGWWFQPTPLKNMSVGMMIIPNWMENHNPFHGSSHHQSGKRALDMFFYGCFKSSDLHVSFNVWLHHLWYVLIQTDLGVKSLDELFTPIAVVVTQLQRKKLFKQI